MIEDHSPVHVGILSFAHTAHAISYTSILSSLDDVILVGIADDDPLRGQRYADQFHLPFYSNLQEMLHQKNLDAVIICSATNQHRELVCFAAQAAKHILVEKPIATTHSDAHAMIDACASAGVLLQIPFVCRFYPMVLAARKMILNGEIGKCMGVVGGNRGVPPLPPVYPEWITDPVQAGGGALMDHSGHVIDAIRFIFGDEVESVFAGACNIRGLGLPVDEGGLISLSFRNGMIATVDPSWSMPDNNPYHYDFYLRILGEKGTIQLDDTRQALTVVSDHPSQRWVNLEPFGKDVDSEMILHFIRCVRAGQNLFPGASGEDGLRSLEIALAAYRSVDLHQPVLLPFERSEP